MARKHYQELADAAMRCSRERSQLQLLLWEVLKHHGVDLRGRSATREDLVAAKLLEPESDNNGCQALLNAKRALLVCAGCGKSMGNITETFRIHGNQAFCLACG